MPKSSMTSWAGTRGSTRTSACWIHLKQRASRPEITGCQQSSANGGGGARSGSNEARTQRNNEENEKANCSYYCGPGTAEFIGGASDARLPSECGIGAARGARLGWNFAPASVLLTGKIGAAGDASQSNQQQTVRRGRACQRRDHRKGESVSGQCARARELDFAAGQACVPHLDGAVVASAQRSVCESPGAARNIVEKRIETRARHASFGSGRSRPRESRSGLDGYVNDRAVRNRDSMARHGATPSKAPRCRETPGAGFVIRAFVAKESCNRIKKRPSHPARAASLRQPKRDSSLDMQVLQYGRALRLRRKI